MRSLGGGDINQTYELELENGTFLFLKKNSGDFPKLFELEATSLRLLKAEGGPTIPSPLAYSDSPPQRFLLMEHLSSGAKKKDYWEKVGRQMARLHLKSHDKFGLAFDNYIGSSPQLNGWSESWIEFFRDKRLRFQFDLALKNNLADKPLADKTEALLDKLSHLIDEPQKVSLIHGDLWAGNLGIDREGNPAIYDPACYYGHHEAELAMTELFGRWDSRAYGAYREVFPLDRGYSERKDVYNLYHLYNHLNLFGSGYYGSVVRILNRYL